MKSARVGRPKGADIENANRRRKQLIDAAVSSIVEHGLASTTLATVARASGLSQSTAVFYFKTKEGLLSEAFRHRMEEYRATWMEAISAAGDDPVDRIVAMIFASLDPKLLTHNDLAFWNAFWPEASQSDSLHAIFEQFEAERNQIMRNLFEEASDQFQDSIWTPRDAAQAVETMVEGVWARLYFSAAHLSAREALVAVGLLLSTIFPGRSEIIMTRATGPEDNSQDK